MYSKRKREVPKEYALMVVSKLAFFGRNKDYVVKHSPFVIWLRIGFCDRDIFGIRDYVADKKES